METRPSLPAALREALGLVRDSVSLLNREAGVVLLFVLFLLLSAVLRFAVAAVSPGEAVRGAVVLFLAAVALAPFAAAAILKVEGVRSGRGLRWMAAFDAAASRVYRMGRKDVAVAALLAVALVAPPLVPADRPEAALLSPAAAVAAMVLLFRDRASASCRLVSASLLLAFLLIQYLLLLRALLTPALVSLFVVQPVFSALGGATVNLTFGNETVNETLAVPVQELCRAVAADPTGFLRCLNESLAPGTYASLVSRFDGGMMLTTTTLVLLLTPPLGLGLPVLLLLPRLALAFPASVLDGGLGLRRTWALTRGLYRVSLALLLLLLGGAAVLVFVPGFWLFAVSGGLAALLILRQVGYGRRVEEAWQETRILALLLVAGAGLALAVLPVLARPLASLFVFSVGTTAFTLFYLKLRAGGSQS